MNLVPNRDCGDCVVCCKVLVIDEPELQKLPGVLCNHAKGGGCTIYETRPGVCRGFFCGWRLLPELGDEWRPDRSDVIIRTQRDLIPQGMQPVGLRFVLFGDTGVIARPGFVEYVGILVERRVAVFLSLRGPDGFSDAGVLLNDHLAEPVARRDRNGVRMVLEQALAALKTNVFESVVLKHAAAAQSGPVVPRD